MSEIIYPRSPRETMAGWAHLPRYIDKIRLHLAGKLPPDYQENLGKGFDGLWLQAAGLTHEQMVEQVRRSITDGEICDWVRRTARKSASDQAAHWEAMLNYPRPDDTAMRERLRLRKEQSGLADRDDIQRFVDYIDADEGRT
jgi:hypothetical protein